MKNATWIVLVLCLLTACGGTHGTSAGSHPSSSAPGPLIPTPTSSVTVEPADPAWSKDESVAAYRTAMRPVTSQLTTLSQMSPSARLAATRTALRSYAQASTAAAESLLQGKWGEDVRGGVNTLIAALLDQETYFDELANGASPAAIRARADKTGQTLLVTRTCAAALEKDLGIGDGLLDLATPGSS